MKKNLVYVLNTILLLFLMIPTPTSAAPSEQPFLAVFCNPGFEFTWCNIRPDYMTTGFSWSQFDDFLVLTKLQAGERPVEIDIDCHGGDNVLLQYHNTSGQTVYSEASAGYVMNHIQTLFKDPKKVIVIMEMCHGGYTWHNSIHGSKAQYNESLVHDPEFPVLGGSAGSTNYGNFVFVQYRTQLYYEIIDLRKFTYSFPVNLDDQKSKKVKRLNTQRYETYKFVNHYFKK